MIFIGYGIALGMAESCGDPLWQSVLERDLLDALNGPE
jgi:hypothetical protein